MLVIVKASCTVTRALPILNSTENNIISINYQYGRDKISRGRKTKRNFRHPISKGEQKQIETFHSTRVLVRENESDVPPMMEPAGMPSTKLTLLAMMTRDLSDGFETVHDCPAVTVPAVLANVAINLSTQVPM